jgi:ABC-type glycerol-3-phosphate transport system substrate-binding protein
MRLRTGLALAVAALLSGCGGSSHTVSTGAAETTTTTSEAEQAEATERAEEKRRIREHEPGHFGP